MKYKLLLFIILGILLIGIVTPKISIKDLFKYDEHDGFKLKEIYEDYIIYEMDVCQEYKDDGTCKKSEKFNWIFNIPQKIRLIYKCTYTPFTEIECDSISKDKEICYLNEEEITCLLGKWEIASNEYDYLKDKLKD